MNNSKAYPKYKDSGVEWLGEIPTSWELRRLGSYFKERRSKVSDKDFAPLSVTKQGILPQLASAAKTNDGDNRKLVRDGDFVINSRSDRKGSSGVALEDGSVSLINIVMEPQNVYPPFCNYLLKGNAFIEEFYRNGHGIVADLWTTRYDEMKNIKIGMPSEDEQTAIADFLDEKVGKVDEAIAQKEHLIELLNERKQIIIQNAVTKGLNPNAPMKDSGIEWIGQIPEHWEVKRAKFLFSESDARSLEGNEELLSVSHMTGVTPRSEKNVNMFLAEDYSGSKICKQGDLVFNIMWAWMGALGVSPTHGIVSPAYGVFSQKNETFHPVYLEWLLKSLKYLEYYNKVSTGLHSSRLRFYPHMFFNMFMGYPAFTEQQEIVSQVQSQSLKIENVITQAEQSIEKLKEYKATLINSAVTGKIDVSTHGH